MPLLRNARIADDGWVFVADDEALPGTGPVVVSLNRFLADRDALIARAGALGLRLEADQSPRMIGADARRFGLIELNFPKFTDGRSYSAARLLRERYGFRGELRAIGNVLRDQLAFMWRCGFDSFVIPDSVNAGKWLSALNEISVHLQPAADGGAEGGPVRLAGGAPEIAAAARRSAGAGQWAY